MSDGSLRFTTTQPKPQSVTLPLCWIPGPTDTPARILHETEWWLDNLLRMTNEMNRLCPYKNGAVDGRSKIVMKLAQRLEWVGRFQEIMTGEQWQRFKRHGFGWMDFPEPNEDLAFTMLECGGNLVNVVGKSGGYALLQAQDFYFPPNSMLTPVGAPHLFVKQVLITKTLRIIIDKSGVGDLYIPLVSPVIPAIPLNSLAFYPAVPFDTTLCGYAVTIAQLAFAGSDTYGYVTDGLDEGWYLLEEMLVIGDPSDPELGGTQDDRRTYCAALERMPIPPPVVGWPWQVWQ